MTRFLSARKGEKYIPLCGYGKSRLCPARAGKARIGGRAFDQYTLPEAILKFRQGFGRLIRSRDDHGIVVVLDNRIVQSHHGKAFLESLPVYQRLIF